MASRKEEKERLRQAREEAEAADRRAQRKRLILGYAVAGVISVAVLAGIVVVIASGGGGDGGDGGSTEGFAAELGAVPEGAVLDEREGTEPPEPSEIDLDAAAEAAGCDLRRNLPDDGNAHFGDEDREGDWSTSPPASGDHYGVPSEAGSGALADGPYLEPPPLSRAVHALEHGRVQIQYSPDLPEADQLALKGVYDADPLGVQLFPNPEMEYAVAAVAWRQLLGCDEFAGPETLDAVRAFTNEFRGQGPEPVPLDI